MDRPPLLVSEVLAIENFVRGGGGILFITDHSNCYYHQYQLLPLWRPLGLVPTFETVCVTDHATSLSSTGSGWALIGDFADHEITAGIRFVATQTGGRVVGEGAIAWTAKEAWADKGATPLYGEGDPGGLYGDFQQSANEDAGKQAVALAKKVGGGRVCVVADQNCVSDAFIAFADNWKFWLNACGWTGRLQYEAPKDIGARIQIDCYEPLSTTKSSRSDELRKFDFGADDPDQLFPFWVWMNRYYWVGASDLESRPPETMCDAKVLIADVLRAHELGFLTRARETLEESGHVIILGDATAQITSVLERFYGANSGRWKVVEATKDSASESPDVMLQVEVYEWFPSGSQRDGFKPSGQLVFVPNAAPLRSQRFPSPNVQPDRKQQRLQKWLQGFLFSH
ncbi:MAG: hypothetical protein Aurels2KO_27460 [Aureliella sp.]